MRHNRLRRISYLLCSLLPTVVFTVYWCPGSSAQSKSRNASSTQVSSNANSAPAAELRRAAELLQSGKPDEAEPILRRVIVSNPDNADAHNLLGVILDQRGQTRAAEREYRTSLRLNPNAISAIANLGVLLAHTKRDDEAIKIFEAVLRAAPDHLQATFNLGLLYASHNEYQRAAQLFTRANELQPQSFDTLYHLGLALYSLKRLDE